MSGQQLQTINAGLPGITSVSQRALDFLKARRAAGQRDELSDGITGGFAVLGYRGKVWRLKFGGEERDLMRTVDGHPEPVPSVGVVLVRAAPGLSKNWYEKGYTEGSNEAPDCFSTNGIAPDPSSPKRQCNVCAACPHNQFGSRVSADGTGRGKACGDSKRIVVVPEMDIDNEENGGPMLLRIPAASLGDLKTYADTLERAGFPYQGVATRLFFDSKEAYPKILMKAIRPLSDEETDKVLGLYEDPRTVRIIEGAAIPQTEQPAPAAPNAALFEQPTPTPAPNAAPAPAPVQPPAAANAESAEEREAREFREFQAAKKAKADAEAKAKAEAEARARAEAEAAAAAAAAQPKVETDEEREFREFQEHKARLAAQNAATAATAAPAATQPAPAPTPAPAAPEATQVASPDDDAAANGQVPAGFDDMLNSLM